MCAGRIPAQVAGCWFREGPEQWQFPAAPADSSEDTTVQGAPGRLGCCVGPWPSPVVGSNCRTGGEAPGEVARVECSAKMLTATAVPAGGLAVGPAAWTPPHPLHVAWWGQAVQSVAFFLEGSIPIASEFAA